MNNDYKSALEKITLSQSEKEKAKALFNKRKKENMRIKKFMKPIAAIAACMAIVLTVGTVTNYFPNKSENNSFVLTVNAKELGTKNTSFVLTNGWAGGMCETEKGGITYNKHFPLKCKGTNISTITYTIKGGVFQITNPVGKSIVVDGKKADNYLSVPSISYSDGKDGDKYSQSEATQYKSFTVDYDRQSADDSFIVIADNTDNWSKDKQKNIKALDFKWDKASIQEEKEVYDLLTDNLSLTCTVTYKDGSTESKDIVITNKIVKLSEINKDIPAEKDGDTVAMAYSIK